MKNIIGLVVFLGFINILIAKELPSQACLSLGANQIESCLDDAYAKWDKQLNVAYTNLMKLIDEKTMKQIRHIQRRWIGLRDDRCIYNIGDEENTKKCLIDETVKQVDRLEQKIIKYDNALKQPLPDKQFEGIWEHCFYLDDRDQEYCTYNYIVQKENKICGSFEVFTSYRYSENNYKGTINSKDLTAQTKKCISYDLPYANTKCFYDESYQPSSEERIYNEEGFTFKLCDKHKLYFAKKGQNCGDLAKEELNQPYIRISNSAKEAIENKIDWSVDDCLEDKDVFPSKSNFSDE